MCRVCRCRTLMTTLAATHTPRLCWCCSHRPTMKFYARPSVVIRRCAWMSSMKGTQSKRLQASERDPQLREFFRRYDHGHRCHAGRRQFTLCDGRLTAARDWDVAGHRVQPRRSRTGCAAGVGVARSAGSPARKRSGLVAVQWTGGQSFRLQLSTLGHGVPGGAGIEWALAMGLLGGLLPALRAARMPVVTALRAI